jgi:spore germination protein
VEDSASGKLLITTAYPVIGGKEKDTVDIMGSDCDLLRESRSNTRLVAPKFIEGGKIQQILISDRLAARGMHDLLEVWRYFSGMYPPPQLPL